VARHVLPAWLSGYRRAWLRPDVIAGVVVWSVVVPQAAAYAQIAGLPPQAGLMAAPGALIAYALLGTSRSLVVSATTATSAVSAAAVGPLAHGDVARFATLSATLALLTGLVLVLGGMLRLGVISDFVSKPVMTGFLFGLGLTIMIGQVPKLLGVDDGSGNFFPRLADLVRELDSIDVTTLVVGFGSLALLLAVGRLAPALPATLVLLAVAISGSALFGLSSHGVDVVGHIPSALPDPDWPGLTDAVDLLPAAFGILILSTEAVGVARSLATAHHYQVDPNRDLSAMGASNLVAGLTSGFVQSGGGSQTAAADRAGGKTQLATLISAGLILLTGAFLAPIFTDLPEASLAAIVIVAVASFLKVGELRRFGGLRRSAIVLALLAVLGVLTLGVLPGLIVTAGLSLAVVIRRLSRPPVVRLGRDPATGGWGAADRHSDWVTTPGVLVIRVEGGLFYANAVAVKEHVLELSHTEGTSVVVLDMGAIYDLDVETLDALVELREALLARGIELRLAAVRVAAARMLRRGHLEVALPASLEEAVGSPTRDEAHPPPVVRS
jgi:SulP family sulfate permease